MRTMKDKILSALEDVIHEVYPDAEAAIVTDYANSGTVYVMVNTEDFVSTATLLGIGYDFQQQYVRVTFSGLAAEQSDVLRNQPRNGMVWEFMARFEKHNDLNEKILHKTRMILREYQEKHPTLLARAGKHARAEQP